MFNPEAWTFFREGMYFSNVNSLVSYLSRLTMKCVWLGHKNDNSWTVNSKLPNLLTFLISTAENYFLSGLASKQANKSWCTACTACEPNMFTWSHKHCQFHDLTANVSLVKCDRYETKLFWKVNLREKNVNYSWLNANSSIFQLMLSIESVTTLCDNT